MSFKEIVIIILSLFAHLALGDNWILETDRLDNQTLLPTMSNGHLGFTMFSTSVYVNGLLNGREKLARIENHANFRLKNCLTSDVGEDSSKCIYRLNIRDGLFETIFEDEQVQVVHEVFPHRFYTRTIVNRFQLFRKENFTKDYEVEVTANPGFYTSDVEYLDDDRFAVNKHQFYCEDGHTVKEPKQNVSYCYTTVKKLVLSAGVVEQEYYTFMMVDIDSANVRHEADKIAFDLNVKERHSSEWHKFWDSFDIQVGSDSGSEDRVTRKLRSIVFYLISSLPSTYTFLQSNPFSGVQNYAEGVLVEPRPEMFIFQSVMFINSYWSQQLLEYFHRIGVITSAALLQLAATHDIDWFRQQGCDMIIPVMNRTQTDHREVIKEELYHCLCDEKYFVKEKFIDRQLQLNGNLMGRFSHQDAIKLLDERIISPFNIWRQDSTGYDLVYIGAFLQVLLNNVGGLQLHFDRLVIEPQHLPSHMNWLYVKGFSYLGGRFELNVTDEEFMLGLLEQSVNDLVVELDGKVTELKEESSFVRGSIGSTVTIKEQSSFFEDCELKEILEETPQRERTTLTVPSISTPLPTPSQTTPSKHTTSPLLTTLRSTSISTPVPPPKSVSKSSLLTFNYYLMIIILIQSLM